MPRFTERDAECKVLTFKDGLLSAIAHDLEIRVERFHVEWDDARSRVEARFEPTSLRVLHAMRSGAPNPSALSDRDRAKIEGNIRDEVLEVRRHPEIRFVSTAVTVDDAGATLKGDLTLHGRTRSIEVRARRSGERWVAEVRLHQPDFGITPYTAMMGTLRIRPEVRVRIETPA